MYLGMLTEEGGSGLSANKMNYAKPSVWDELKCVDYVTKFSIIAILRICILV